MVLAQEALKLGDCPLILNIACAISEFLTMNLKDRGAISIPFNPKLDGTTVRLSDRPQSNNPIDPAEHTVIGEN
jgi:hypothetical protein